MITVLLMQDRKRKPFMGKNKMLLHRSGANSIEMIFFLITFTLNDLQDPAKLYLVVPMALDHFTIAFLFRGMGLYLLNTSRCVDTVQCHRRCSKWQQATSLHNEHILMMFFRTLWKIPERSIICAATEVILLTKSDFTGVS